MNELITLEINSKNKQKLIDLLNESNLIVEYMNIEQTYTVARPTGPVDVVCLTTPYISEAEKLSTASCSPGTSSKGIAGPGVSFNYSISETV